MVWLSPTNIVVCDGANTDDLKYNAAEYPMTETFHLRFRSARVRSIEFDPQVLHHFHVGRPRNSKLSRIAMKMFNGADIYPRIIFGIREQVSEPALSDRRGFARGPPSTGGAGREPAASAPVGSPLVCRHPPLLFFVIKSARDYLLPMSSSSSESVQRGRSGVPRQLRPGSGADRASFTISFLSTGRMDKVWSGRLVHLPQPTGISSACNPKESMDVHDTALTALFRSSSRLRGQFETLKSDAVLTHADHLVVRCNPKIFLAHRSLSLAIKVGGALPSQVLPRSSSE